jgi:hypothetical protein
MGGHKTISGSSYPIPAPPAPPPIADYHVTGTLTPDATGNYFLVGTHHEKPYYKHENKSFWILYDMFFGFGLLVDGIPDSVHTWENLGVYPLGDYVPLTEETFGTAHVIEGPT